MRLIKLSKNQKPTHDSFIGSRGSSGGETPQISLNSFTSPRRSLSKLGAAQSGLQACEAHLATKEKKRTPGVRGPTRSRRSMQGHSGVWLKLGRDGQRGSARPRGNRQSCPEWHRRSFQVDAFVRGLVKVLGGTGNTPDDDDDDDSHEQDKDAQLAAVLALSGGGQYQGDDNLEAQALATRSPCRSTTPQACLQMSPRTQSCLQVPTHHHPSRYRCRTKRPQRGRIMRPTRIPNLSLTPWQ